MTTIRALARLTAAFVPALLLLPVGAHAERVVVGDPAGDAVRFDEAASEEAGTDVAVPAPREVSADVTRVVVDHRADALRLTVQVRDLRVHRFFDQVEVRLRTPQWSWGIAAYRSGRETYTTLTRGARESTRTCGGLISTVDTRADRVVVTVPTTCLEDPRWVRVGVAALAASVSSTAPFVPDVYWDEAGVRGFEEDRVQIRSPKVHRG